MFGVSIAIFLSQDFLPRKLEVLLKNIIELLAAIPSVVYGLWGIFVVIPMLRPPANWLHEHLGQIPIFGTTLSGPGMLPASLVLAIMVLPTISAISRDALVSVPPKLKEAALGLGATALGNHPGSDRPHGFGRHLRLDHSGFRPSAWAKPWPWPCWSAIPTS